MGHQSILKPKKMIMKKLKKLFFVATASLLANVAFGQMDNPMEKTVKVGGAAMYPSRNIIENAVNSKDHTTLVAAVKAAGLVETLQGKGPFTVFAPTNAAFDLLPAGTVEGLLKPESKATLARILTYHVVAGRLGSAELVKLIREGKGSAELKTVSGDKLVIMMKGRKIELKDEKGGLAYVTIGDVNQSNGVIHVIDVMIVHSESL
jgi:uncharacterized surface protein with fasciclin (FAS1) repeats